MQEFLQQLLQFFTGDNLVYVALFAECIFSIVQNRQISTLKKQKSSKQVCSEDIQALIEYHKKVANELEKNKVSV